jgi:hypothetical protein
MLFPLVIQENLKTIPLRLDNVNIETSKMEQTVEPFNRSIVEVKILQEALRTTMSDVWAISEAGNLLRRMNTWAANVGLTTSTHPRAASYGLAALSLIHAHILSLFTDLVDLCNDGKYFQ